jgi:hypothetical protein
VCALAQAQRSRELCCSVQVRECALEIFEMCDHLQCVIVRWCCGACENRVGAVAVLLSIAQASTATPASRRRASMAVFSVLSCENQAKRKQRGRANQRADHCCAATTEATARMPAMSAVGVETGKGLGWAWGRQRYRWDVSSWCCLATASREAMTPQH